MSLRNFKFGFHFFVGVIFICFAFYLCGPVLFTSKGELIERNGQIKTANIEYPRVRSRGMVSTKCELSIDLEGDIRRYSIFKNIGQKKKYPKFEDLKNKLRTSQSVSVWINKSEESKLEPNVYRIINQDDKILYSIKDAKALSLIVFTIACLFGLALIFIIPAN